MVPASEVLNCIETSIPRRIWEDNIKMVVSGSGMLGVWTESSWFRIGTDGGHL